MRGFGAPLLLVAARARRRPGRWLLPALGIAIAAAFGAGVAAEAAVAGDESARSVLTGLPPLDRTVRVTWQGAVTPAVAQTARGLLGGLGLGRRTEVVLLNPVRLGGVVVRPAAVAPLDRWLAGPAARRLGRCRASRCPMLLASGGALPTTLAATGVRISVVGSGRLESAVPLGFSPIGGAGPPVLVTGDPAGLQALGGLSGVYRTHSWLAPLPVARLHSWELRALEGRLARSEAALLASGSQFSLSAPFDGLDQALAEADAAPRRLLLVGGGAAAALALFVVLAASGMRRDQLTELGRLRNAGARTDQCVLFVAAESAWLCAAALSAGAAVGILAAAVLARAAGEPVGGVLAHSLLRPGAGVALAAAWALATALMALTVLARDDRVVNALAIAAASALTAGLVVTPAGDEGLALSLAPLCCLAAGVLAFRLAGGLLRAGERAARGGPVLARLALVGLARAPSLPSAAIAFVAVSVGLGGFALAYRATLTRGASDQAADRVPLDAIISPGPGFHTPLQLAPPARWSAIVGGAVLPVRRTEASYMSGGGTVTVPALGVPAGGLARIHGWRSSDGSAPLAVLGRLLRPPGPVRSPGPALPAPTRWLSVRVASNSLAVTVTADLRDPQGMVTQVPLGTAAGRPTFLRARLPGGRWELEALQLDEPTGLEVTNGHQNAENAAAATQQQELVALGPAMALSADRKPLLNTPLRSWLAVGGAAVAGRTASGDRVSVAFATTGEPGVIRPEQPSDTRPVPVLVDPQTAAAAGPGGRLVLAVDGLPVIARVVGELRRFPTLASDAAGFVVADEATLSSALDAQLPGQGRPDELWVATAHPAILRAALARPPLAQLSSSFRVDLERELRAAPLARGVLGTLIAATAASAALAVLGLLTAFLGTARDRGIERDLEAQGIGPRGLRSELRTRLGLASFVGVTVGLAIAVLLVRLAVVAVRAAGTLADPRPELVAVAPWAQLGAWGLGAVVVLLLCGWLATRSPR